MTVDLRKLVYDIELDKGDAFLHDADFQYNHSHQDYVFVPQRV